MALAKRSLHLTPNQDSSIDTRYPDGSKPFVQPSSLGVNTNAFNAANINLSGLSQGQIVTYNYRQYLTGTSSNTATLSVNAISGNLNGWKIDSTGNSLTNVSATPGSGSLQVIANDNAGTIVSFPIEPWSIVAVSNTQKKIWRPGHAAGFATIMSGTGISAPVKAEMDAIKPYSNVLGYMASCPWGWMEPIPGETDVTAQYPNGYATGAARIRQVYDYLAAMTPARDTTIKFQLGGFTSTHPGINDFSIIPQYIQTNSIYGPAGYRVAGTTTTVSGRYGWWGGDGNGNTYAACFHRSAIMNRLILLAKAMSTYFDGLAFFYGWSLDENSFVGGASSANNCPDFSNSTADVQLKAYISQCVGSWKRAHFLIENSYWGNPTQNQSLTDYLMKAGAVQSNTDVMGLTYSNAHNGNPLSWGMAQYCGFSGGGTLPTFNYRDAGYPLMTEVQATDMGAYGQFAGGYTKEDILAELNQVLKATRAWWAVVNATEGSIPKLKPNSVWSFMGPFLNNPANALTNTTYPSNAPGYT